MLRWLTLICDTKAHGCCLRSLQQLMGGQGKEDNSLQELCFKLQFKSLLKTIGVFLCADDTYWTWRDIFHIISYCVLIFLKKFN